jgi:hypothetical protein
MQLLLGLLLFELVACLALHFRIYEQLGFNSQFWLGVSIIAVGCLALLLSLRALVVRRGWFTLREFMVCVLVIGGACGWIGHRFHEKSGQRHIAAFLTERGVSVQWAGDNRPGLERLIGREYFHDVVSIKDVWSELKPEEMVILRGLKGLHVVTLHGGYITDAHLGPLADVASLRRLNLLQGTRCTGAGLIHFRGHNSLEELLLDGKHFDEKQLAHLQHLPRLKRLVITFSITETGMKHLAQCKNLEMLWVAAADGPSLIHLAKVPGLLELNIGGDAIEESDLAPLASLTNLRSLTLDCRSVPDGGRGFVARLNNVKTPAHIDTLLWGNRMDWIDAVYEFQGARSEFQRAASIKELNKQRSELSKRKNLLELQQ